MITMRGLFTSLVILSALVLSERLPETFPPSEHPLVGPLHDFKTEPDFQAVKLNVKLRHPDSSLLSEEFIFFAISTFDPVGSWGPQIFDPDGNLVFFNDAYEPPLAMQDPHVCDFEGQIASHLCIGDVGEAVRGRWLTTKVVYDAAYKPVAKFTNDGDVDAADGHEFNMLPGGESFLQPVYQRRTMDLSGYEGPAHGSIFDGCFQEIHVRTGEEIFRWCYLDHFPIDDTYIYMRVPGNTMNLSSSISGHGDEGWPWDFLHLNSIDKNEEGDYLLSARHSDQIFKVAGPNNRHGVEPGTTLWRLGGKHGDLTTFQTLFSRQHHARFVKTGPEETTISLFDNAWEGANDPTATASSGKVIVINNRTMHAHISGEYRHPDGHLALAQGSMQHLRNGNFFVGWGWVPQITEFSKDGEILYHAELAEDKPYPHPTSYRTYRSTWIGRPTWEPKLVVYSRTCERTKESPLVAYVSWNGATEVRSWRFYVSVSSRAGPWIPAGTKAKRGFETDEVLLDDKIGKYLPFVRHVFVQALDSKGRVLGSTTSDTYVPGWPANAEMCDARGCFEPPHFSYAQEYSSAALCGASHMPAWAALLFVLLLIEVTVYLGKILFFRIFGNRSWTEAYKYQIWLRQYTDTLHVEYFRDSKHSSYRSSYGDESRRLSRLLDVASPMTHAARNGGSRKSSRRHSRRMSQFFVDPQRQFHLDMTTRALEGSSFAASWPVRPEEERLSRLRSSSF